MRFLHVYVVDFGRMHCGRSLISAREMPFLKPSRNIPYKKIRCWVVHLLVLKDNFMEIRLKNCFAQTISCFYFCVFQEYLRCSTDKEKKKHINWLLWAFNLDLKWSLWKMPKKRLKKIANQWDETLQIKRWAFIFKC